VAVVDITANHPSRSIACPYCGRSMRWSPARWLAHGVFECDRCGEFPDFRDIRREQHLREEVILRAG
jgi:transposase